MSLALNRRLLHIIRFVTVMALVLASLMVATDHAEASTAAQLTRYPYVTDSIQNSITATKMSITVISAKEYQWKASLGVSPGTTYCYRVWFGSTDLLSSDATPLFTSQVATTSGAPYSFAVLGDWGQAYAGGVNADQTNVLRQIKLSLNPPVD